MAVGENIRYYRKKAGLTLAELGENVGVTGQCISQLERGVRDTSTMMIVTISKALNILEQDLFSPTQETLGGKIAKARKAKKLTQQQLADEINKTESSIRKYEAGVVEPSITVIKEVARALDVTFQDLINLRSCNSSKLEKSVQEMEHLTTEQLRELIQKATNELIRRIDRSEDL